jgi:hypothetical protein
MKPLASARLAALVAAFVAAVFVAPDARADYIDHFANPHDIGILKIPRTGSPRILVVPIIVEDLPFEGGVTEEQWLSEVRAFYAPDAEGWAFSPYFKTASLGRYTPVAEVAEPVRFDGCPPIGGFADCEIPRGAGFQSGDLNTALLVLRDALFFIDEILACASEGPGGDRTCTDGGGVDFTRFDAHGPNGEGTDGVADGVIFVSNAGFPGIALPVKDLSEAGLLSFLGPFPAFTYDDTVVGAVAIAGVAVPPQRATFVSVHELGHLLGWCDLYSESGVSTSMPYTVMGGWFYSEAASLPDAYSRAAAGWAHVIQHSGNKTYTIGGSADVGTVIKVGTGEEFFMVELREKRDDVDADMEAERGVVVERVRLQKRPAPERGSYPGTLVNYVNDVPDDAFLIIEQADGLFDLERRRARKDNDDMFKPGDSIAPSDDTAPRTAQHRVFSTNRFDGSRTDITITVTELASGSASIEIDAPEVEDACAEIAALCGALPCEDGACGAVAGDPAVIPPEGCGCGAVDRSLSALVLALALSLRRRRPPAR